MNKKGTAIAVVAVILALTILGFFLVDVALRECNSNKDCAANAYCGSDNECHQFPESVVLERNDFLPAALVIGIAIIIAAYIFKKGKKEVIGKY